MPSRSAEGIGNVKTLRRYAVKSMNGEVVDEAFVTKVPLVGGRDPRSGFVPQTCGRGPSAGTMVNETSRRAVRDEMNEHGIEHELLRQAMCVLDGCTIDTETEHFMENTRVRITVAADPELLESCGLRCHFRPGGAVVSPRPPAGTFGHRVPGAGRLDRRGHASVLDDRRWPHLLLRGLRLRPDDEDVDRRGVRRAHRSRNAEPGRRGGAMGAATPRQTQLGRARDH